MFFYIQVVTSNDNEINAETKLSTVAALTIMQTKLTKIIVQ